MIATHAREDARADIRKVHKVAGARLVPISGDPLIALNHITTAGITNVTQPSHPVAARMEQEHAYYPGAIDLGRAGEERVD